MVSYVQSVIFKRLVSLVNLLEILKFKLFNKKNDVEPFFGKYAQTANCIAF